VDLTSRGVHFSIAEIYQDTSLIEKPPDERTIPNTKANRSLLLWWRIAEPLCGRSATGTLLAGSSAHVQQRQVSVSAPFLLCSLHRRTLNSRAKRREQHFILLCILWCATKLGILWIDLSYSLEPPPSQLCVHKVCPSFRLWKPPCPEISLCRRRAWEDASSLSAFTQAEGWSSSSWEKGGSWNGPVEPWWRKKQRASHPVGDGDPRSLGVPCVAWRSIRAQRRPAARLFSRILLSCSSVPRFGHMVTGCCTCETLSL